LSRIIALDIGDARIGVAISDPLGMFAQPWKSIQNTAKKAHQELVELMRENDITTVICGMPSQLDGELGLQAEKTQKFATRLENIFKSNKDLHHCKVMFFDERFTSIQAERVLAGSGLKNSERAAARDRIAAALILEGYLESIRA